MRLDLDKETINILSIKYRLNASTIESIVDHSLKCIKECMVMDEMPNILIHNLGRFKPQKSLLDSKFISTVNFVEKYPEKANTVDWKYIKNLLEVYNRIIKEEKLKEHLVISKIKTLISNNE